MASAGRPPRRLHRHQEGRQRGRAQPHPTPAQGGACAPRAPLEAEADHDYVLMARREALARSVRRARRGSAPGVPRHRAQRQRQPPAAGATDAKGQRQATMNSEDTRNLFLAIALSVLVMAGWQYFFAGPMAQRQHQAQIQTQSQTVQSPSAGQPAQGAEPQPGRHRGARRRRRAGRRRNGDASLRRSRRAPGSQSTRRASAARSTSRAASSTTSCSRTTTRRSAKRAR